MLLLHMLLCLLHATHATHVTCGSKPASLSSTTWHAVAPMLIHAVHASVTVALSQAMCRTCSMACDIMPGDMLAGMLAIMLWIWRVMGKDERVDVQPFAGERHKATIAGAVLLCQQVLQQIKTSVQLLELSSGHTGNATDALPASLPMWWNLNPPALETSSSVVGRLHAAAV